VSVDDAAYRAACDDLALADAMLAIRLEGLGQGLPVGAMRLALLTVLHTLTTVACQWSVNPPLAVADLAAIERYMAEMPDFEVATVDALVAFLETRPTWPGSAS
jgi:hypothetical protein